MTTREVILDGGSPWGFRMHGGADVHQPLRISRVNPGSKASMKGIREGDLITSINGQSTKDITNSEAHSLLKSAGDKLKLGLNEEGTGSPKRRHYNKTVLQETHSSETIKRSSVTSTTSYSITSNSNSCNNTAGNQEETSTTPPRRTNGVQHHNDDQNGGENGVGGIASQRSTLSSSESNHSTNSSDLKGAAASCDCDAMADNASGNSRSKRRRRANRKRSKKTKTSETTDIHDEKCESDADETETRTVEEEITTFVNKRVEITENYRVESPKTIAPKPSIGTVVKSRSLDDEEMLKITEISESDCDDKSECNSAIIAEADSDVEWESTENLALKPPTLTLNLQQPSIDLQQPTIQQPIPISPEEEKNLRDFLQTINLVTSPQKTTTTKTENLKAKRRRKREQLAQYFMPVYHNQRYLDAISEESDLSDHHTFEKHGVQFVHTPIIQQDVCYTKNVQVSSRAEIVILEDTTSSNESSQSDDAEETANRIDGFDLTPPPTPENEKESDTKSNESNKEFDTLEETAENEKESDLKSNEDSKEFNTLGATPENRKESDPMSNGKDAHETTTERKFSDPLAALSDGNIEVLNGCAIKHEVPIKSLAENYENKSETAEHTTVIIKSIAQNRENKTETPDVIRVKSLAADELSKNELLATDAGNVQVDSLAPAKTGNATETPDIISSQGKTAENPQTESAQREIPTVAATTIVEGANSDASIEKGSVDLNESAAVIEQLQECKINQEDVVVAKELSESKENVQAVQNLQTEIIEEIATTSLIEDVIEEKSVVVSNKIESAQQKNTKTNDNGKTNEINLESEKIIVIQSEESENVKIQCEDNTKDELLLININNENTQEDLHKKNNENNREDLQMKNNENKQEDLPKKNIENIEEDLHKKNNDNNQQDLQKNTQEDLPEKNNENTQNDFPTKNNQALEDTSNGNAKVEEATKTICDATNHLEKRDVKSCDNNPLGESNPNNIIDVVTKTSVNTPNKVPKSEQTIRLDSGLTNEENKNGKEPSNQVLTAEYKKEDSGTKSTLSVDEDENLALSDDELLLEKIRKKNMDYKKAALVKKTHEVIILAETPKKHDVNKTKQQTAPILSDSMKKYFGIGAKRELNDENCEEKIDELFAHISEDVAGENDDLSIEEANKEKEHQSIEAIVQLSQVLEKNSSESSANKTPEITEKHTNVLLNANNKEEIISANSSEELRNERELKLLENMAKDSFPRYGIVRDFVISSSEENKEQSASNIKINVRKIYGQESPKPSKMIEDTKDNLESQVKFEVRKVYGKNQGDIKAIKHEKNQKFKDETKAGFKQQESVQKLETTKHFEEANTSNTILKEISRTNEEIKNFSAQTLNKTSTLKREEKINPASQEVLIPITIEDINTSSKGKSTGAIKKQPKPTKTEQGKPKERTIEVKTQKSQSKMEKEVQESIIVQNERIVPIAVEDGTKLQEQVLSTSVENTTNVIPVTIEVEETPSGSTEADSVTLMEKQNVKQEEHVIPITIEGQIPVQNKQSVHVIPITIEKQSKHAERNEPVTIDEQNTRTERVVPLTIEEQNQTIQQVELIKVEEQNRHTKHVQIENRNKQTEHVTIEEHDKRTEHVIPVRIEEQNKGTEHVIVEEQKLIEHVIPVTIEEQIEHVIPVRLDKDIEIIPLNVCKQKPNEHFIPINIEDSEMLNKCSQSERVIDVEIQKDPNALIEKQTVKRINEKKDNVRKSNGNKLPKERIIPIQIENGNTQKKNTKRAKKNVSFVETGSDKDTVLKEPVFTESILKSEEHSTEKLIKTGNTVNIIPILKQSSNEKTYISQSSHDESMFKETIIHNEQIKNAPKLERIIEVQLEDDLNKQKVPKKLEGYFFGEELPNTARMKTTKSENKTEIKKSETQKKSTISIKKESSKSKVDNKNGCTSMLPQEVKQNKNEKDKVNGCKKEGIKVAENEQEKIGSDSNELREVTKNEHIIEVKLENGHEEKKTVTTNETIKSENNVGILNSSMETNRSNEIKTTTIKSGKSSEEQNRKEHIIPVKLLNSNANSKPDKSTSSVKNSKFIKKNETTQMKKEMRTSNISMAQNKQSVNKKMEMKQDQLKSNKNEVYIHSKTEDVTKTRNGMDISKEIKVNLPESVTNRNKEHIIKVQLEDDKNTDDKLPKSDFNKNKNAANKSQDVDGRNKCKEGNLQEGNAGETKTREEKQANATEKSSQEMKEVKLVDVEVKLPTGETDEKDVRILAEDKSQNIEEKQKSDSKTKTREEKQSKVTEEISQKTLINESVESSTTVTTTGATFSTEGKPIGVEASKKIEDLQDEEEKAKARAKIGKVVLKRLQSQNEEDLNNDRMEGKGDTETPSVGLERFDESFQKVFKEVLDEQEKVINSFHREHDETESKLNAGVGFDGLDQDVQKVKNVTRESSASSDTSVCTTQCTVKSNPTRSSIADVNSILKEADITDEDALEGGNPETLKEICVTRLLSLPFGADILEELAAVSKSLEEFTDRLPKRRFHIPASEDGGGRAFSTQKVSNGSFTIPADEWVGLDADPSTQKEFLDGHRREPVEAERLLELHEKFLNRRCYNESSSDGVSLLGGIKEEDEKGLKDDGFLELHSKFLKQRDLNESKQAFLSKTLKGIKEDIEEQGLLAPARDENRLLKFLRCNSENPGATTSTPIEANRRKSEDLELKRWSSVTLPSEARLKARGLSEWLQLARGGVNLENCANTKTRSANNLEKRAPLLPPRRRSLPHELYVKQMQYLIQKEKEIQDELETLEKEKRTLNTQMYQVQQKRQFQPADYKISKNGDVAELDETRKPPEGNEKFRQIMYQEYMDQLAAREQRKHKKVIKISMNDADEPKKPIDNDLETEFMTKAKRRMQKQGLHDDPNDTENDDLKEKVLIINGDEIKQAKKLPKHLKEFVDIAQLDELPHENEGIWSPGQRHERNEFNAEERKRVEVQGDRAAIPPVWTPRSAGSSPTAERKEFRPLNFESPVLGRKARTKSDGSATLTLTEPPWKNASSGGEEPPVIEKRLPTSFSAPGPGFGDSSRLPRAQNPTITLLQKAREGQIPKSAAYIEQERARRKNESPYSSSDIIYQVRTESISDSDSERPRKITVTPRKYEGIGPTTKDGMPITLRSEVRDGNMSQWYKKMYDTIHKQKPKDEYVMVRYKQRRARYPYTTGYLSEPEPGAYDSDATMSDNKFSTLDRRRPVSHKESNEYAMSSTLPRSAMSTSTISYRPDVQHTTETYKNQPGRIENYTPGQSSISDKEAKKWWDEVMEIFDGWLDDHSALPSYSYLLNKAIVRSHLEQQKRVPQTKGYMSQALKESGYESDSTLVFRRRDDTAQLLSPLEQKEVYKNIQKGGDVPLHGLRKPAPERPKEPEVPPPPPPKGNYECENTDSCPESPRKYVENEVTIHYRTPVRREVKESLSEDELAKRQADAMRKIYEEERRRKYLQELHDMNSRRHTDNFIPSQKSPIPLNRYDDFLDELSPRVKPRPRSPEPRLVARALYNFVGQTSRELTFKKGDVIYIRRQVDKNWYEGEINAMIGLFPANYVEIIPYDGIKTTPRKPHEGQARAKYNFIAQTHLELSLAKGELVVVTRRVDDNWFEGKIGGRKGIFPVSYVEVLIDPGESGATPPPTKPVASPAAHSLLLNGSAGGKESMGSHNYVPTFPTQDLGMSYRAKPVQITGGGGSNYGSLKKSPMDQALHIETQSEPVPYRALYKYRPQNEDELELLEGDTVYVLEKCDDGWYVGSSERTGAFGTFPGNYVERI